MIELNRSDCVILPLVLKRKWFDMIDRGEKLEEYRDATEYWRVRLNNFQRRCRPGKFPVVEFRDGYRKDARRMSFMMLKRTTYGGVHYFSFVYNDGNSCSLHPDLGEPEAPHYIIMLGRRIKLT